MKTFNELNGGDVVYKVKFNSNTCKLMSNFEKVRVHHIANKDKTVKCLATTDSGDYEIDDMFKFYKSGNKSVAIYYDIYDKSYETIYATDPALLYDTIMKSIDDSIEMKMKDIARLKDNKGNIAIMFKSSFSGNDQKYHNINAWLDEHNIKSKYYCIDEGVVWFNDEILYNEMIDALSSSIDVNNVSGLFERNKISFENIPDYVKFGNIPSMAFSSMKNMTEIEIPDSVTKIGRWAFFNCRDLNSVTIHKSVDTIEEKAFYQCVRLKSIYTESDNVERLKSILEDRGNKYAGYVKAIVK